MLVIEGNTMKHAKTEQCHMLHNASGNQFSVYAKFTRSPNRLQFVLHKFRKWTASITNKSAFKTGGEKWGFPFTYRTHLKINLLNSKLQWIRPKLHFRCFHKLGHGVFHCRTENCDLRIILHTSTAKTWTGDGFPLSFVILHTPPCWRSPQADAQATWHASWS